MNHNYDNHMIWFISLLLQCANGFFYRESCNSVNSDLYCCDEQDICGETGLLNTVQDFECRFLPNESSCK